MESKELIIAVVTILGSGAAFKFYESFIKSKKEEARELRQERREENPETMFREDLLKRVNEMSTSLETAQSEILRLTQKVAELETENRYLQREIDILKRG
jgi:predicted nuclease with TOPRIM domain